MGLIHYLWTIPSVVVLAILIIMMLCDLVSGRKVRASALLWIAAFAIIWPWGLYLVLSVLKDG